jgi:uncharacterized protein YjfI (DUF2170 family)
MIFLSNNCSKNCNPLKFDQLQLKGKKMSRLSELGLNNIKKNYRVRIGNCNYNIEVIST